MTAHFDEQGDLWVDVDLKSIPKDRGWLVLGRIATYSPGSNGGAGVAATKLNLTAYIKMCTRPDWVNAALTPSSAQVTIVGNTPTTGGLTEQQHKDWLGTIPEPIEPAA